MVPMPELVCEKRSGETHRQSEMLGEGGGGGGKKWKTRGKGAGECGEAGVRWGM